MKRTWTRITIAVALVLVVAFPFLTNAYILGIAQAMLLYFIYAMAMNLLMGYTGIRSFGQAGFWGVGAYVTGLMMNMHQYGILSLLGAMIIGAVLGLAVGMLSLRLQSVYFFITTLGVSEMLRVIAINWMPVTRGPMGLMVQPTSMGLFLGRFEYQTQVYLLSVLLAVLCFLGLRTLMRSHTGKILMSIRDSEPLADSVGVNPTAYKVFAFATAGAITALSGGLNAMAYRIVVPDFLSMQYTTIGLLMVLIGGSGELWGPLFGALIYVGFNEGLRSIGEFRLVIFALIMILVVMLFPKGLIGTLKQQTNKIKQRKQQT
ncbi:MAG: branched-chain amino acid ABC transporter permease [Christensenellaceae bacterium]|jgi:ABC-type branched-subunit amino acid transport system permease subunit|nr:branched-chain amino acid ABC transporter permease [Christensenellaceae bacterium]